MFSLYGKLDLNLCMCSCISLTNRKRIMRRGDEIVRGGERTTEKSRSGDQLGGGKKPDSGSEEEMRSKAHDVHVIFTGHGEPRYFVCQCE